MISGTINSKVSSKEMFEGVRFSVDLWSSPDQVKIQVGNQEAVLSKEMFLQASNMVEEAKLSNRLLPINIVDGKLV